MLWINLIVGAGALQGLMLAIYLFGLSRHRRQRALRWLGSFVLAFSLILLNDVLIQSRLLFDVPHLYQVFDFLILWLGPLLYGYVRLVLGLPAWSWRQALAHLCAGLLILLLLLPEIFSSAAMKRLAIEQELALVAADKAFNWVSTLVLLQVLAYWIVSLTQLSRYQRSLEQRFSALDRYRLVWLKHLLWICGPLWVFWAISIMTPWLSAVYLSQVGFALGVYALGYRGMRQAQLWSEPLSNVGGNSAGMVARPSRSEQPELSRGSEAESLDNASPEKLPLRQERISPNLSTLLQPLLPDSRFESSDSGSSDSGSSHRESSLPESPILEPSLSQARYAKSGLNASALAAIDQRLEELMRRELCFLEPDLSLAELAERLGVTTHALSQTLNMHRRQNFFEFVNALRVNEVRRCFADSAFDRQSILEIALAAGFASKATFNATFKRFTGMTPSQFRQQK